MEHQQRNPYKNIVLLLVTFIIFFAFGNQCGNMRKQEEINKIQESLNDSLRVFRDKEGKLHGKISVLETNNLEQFLSLGTKDKEIKELQDLVYKYKKRLSNQGSATIIKTITEYDTVKEVPEEYKKLLSQFREGIFDTINNRFITSIFGFKGDSTYYSLVTRDRYSVVIGQESQGWFKPKKTVVEVISDNPYTQFSSVRAYQVLQPKEKRFSLGPQIGYGFTQEGTQIYIGLGLQYNLIKF